MRLAIAVLFGMFSAHSMASFELMLVLDRADKVVHRYDSESGTYLGALGAGYIQNPKAMALDQTNNRVYVLQERASAPLLSYLTVLDYNSGAFLGTVGFPQGNVSGLTVLNNGMLATNFGSSDITRISPTGSTAGTVSIGTPVVAGRTTAFAQDGNGTLWGLNENGVLYGWVSPFSVNGGLPVVSAGAAGTPQPRGPMEAYGNLLVGANGFEIWWRQVGLASPGVQTNYLTGMTVTDVAIGHNRSIYAVGTNSNGAMVQRWDTFWNQNGTFGQAQLTDPISVAVVVAPEPVSIFALGAGLVGLIRRRRRNTSG